MNLWGWKSWVRLLLRKRIMTGQGVGTSDLLAVRFLDMGGSHLGVLTVIIH